MALERGAPPVDARLGSLPPQPARLIGRADELTNGQSQVLAPDVRLLTLVGPGGVGKTRLAIGTPRRGLAEGEQCHVGRRAGRPSEHQALLVQTLPWDELLAVTQEPAVQVRTTQPRLTRREREVLTLIAEGQSNREIAGTLIVSENTAKYHVAQLLNKLRSSTRAEAVTQAVRSGLLTPTIQ